MNNILLIIKRTYLANFNKITKIILGIIAFFVGVAVSVGMLVLEKNVFPNDFKLNLAFIGKNILITLFVFVIIKKIQKDFKKGLLKNLLLNNFTKQQYYFGTTLAWFFLLFLLMITNLIFIYAIWATDLGFPQASQINYLLFDLFYIFIAPTAVFWFLILINYLSFVSQKWDTAIELLLLFFLILSIIWVIIFTQKLQFDGVSESTSYWQNYIYFLLPFYNLIFSVPQNWSLTHITYWWVYLIDLVYLLVLIPIFYFCLAKPKMMINGKKSTHYFS